MQTDVESGNYAALHIRYTVPGGGALRETVAVLSPAQPLADAFRFVTAASRPPNQRARLAGTAAQLDDGDVRRRNRLRGAAAAGFDGRIFNALPPEPTITMGLWPGGKASAAQPGPDADPAAPDDEPPDGSSDPP